MTYLLVLSAGLLLGMLSERSYQQHEIADERCARNRAETKARKLRKRLRKAMQSQGYRRFQLIGKE